MMSDSGQCGQQHKRVARDSQDLWRVRSSLPTGPGRRGMRDSKESRGQWSLKEQQAEGGTWASFSQTEFEMFAECPDEGPSRHAEVIPEFTRRDTLHETVKSASIPRW